MGQSSSSSRPPNPSPQPSSSSVPANPSAEPGPSRRRSNVRKSILNFVKHRSSNDSTRRSWRYSRRFSKTPVAEPSEKGKEREQDVSDEDPQPTEQEPDPEEDEVVISPEQFEPPPTEPVPDPQPVQEQQPTTNRQFPPPGTLVVVQGVVHTTDIPRPNQNSDPPAPEPAESARPPTPAASEDHSTTRNRLSDLLRSRPSSMVAPIVEDASPTEPSSDSSAAAPTAAAGALEPSASNAISSSSIDVLGTLLSVAAAATAASLLTGSSEPMQTSGLAPPPPTMMAEPSPPSLSRPTSPTPTAGLGYGSDLTGGRTDRMRHAWGSIRERLGLRQPGDRGIEPSRSNSDVPSVDARERMLAEMTRAFNMGLGIGSNDVNPPEPGADNALSLPPEGSFERFLLDLQSDLRVALTHSDSQAIPSESRPSSDEAASSSSHQDPDSSDSDSDSESEFEAEDEEEEAEQITPPAEGENDESPASPGSDNDSGRINWWRLYRFPPIPAPRIPMQPDSTTIIPPMQPEPTTAPELPAEQPASQTEASSSDSSTPPRPNIVVPVIVVGLQSVNMGGWQHLAAAMPPPPAPDAAPPTLHEEPPNMPETPVPTEPTAPTSPERPSTPRGRRWHERAANAFRNLRPHAHRPGGQPGLPDLEAPGTRTFLIYVIGGYYPPDHSIVTGEPNNFDSFEALLDLAELLGQVKPPTVSKDDIENSGLEVVKASQVAQYEKEGKISSNCTEKCLICLDEYDPEDQVRLMSCRHAFHMDCVDRWLQTGRNNCPACRSRGVSSSAPQSPTGIIS